MNGVTAAAIIVFVHVVAVLPLVFVARRLPVAAALLTMRSNEGSSSMRTVLCGGCYKRSFAVLVLVHSSYVDVFAIILLMAIMGVMSLSS